MRLWGPPPPIVYINIWGAVRGVVWDEVGVFSSASYEEAIPEYRQTRIHTSISL